MYCKTGLYDCAPFSKSFEAGLILFTKITTTTNWNWNKAEKNIKLLQNLQLTDISIQNE